MDQDTGAIFAICLLLGPIFGAVTAVIASGKGRDGLGWFFLGAFFGPLAILAAAVVSPIERELPERFRQPSEPSEETEMTSAAISDPVPAPTPDRTARPFVSDEIAKLADLRDRGALTDEEFTAAKAKLLA